MQIINGQRLPTVTEHGIYGFFGDYRFLSNFHVIPIALDGLVYPSSEHAYMAQKTDDLALRAQLAALVSPAAAKNFGQTVPLKPNWDAKRLEAMDRVLRVKFSDPRLGQALLATGDRYLEETNNWSDRFWGVCDGTGFNFLGLTLMRLRNELRLRGRLLDAFSQGTLF